MRKRHVYEKTPRSNHNVTFKSLNVMNVTFESQRHVQKSERYERHDVQAVERDVVILNVTLGC